MRRTTRGSNVVEFALLMPVFCTVVLGLMDLGWVFAAQAEVDRAVNQGCRDAALIDSVKADPHTAADAAIRSHLGQTVSCGQGCTIALSDEGAVPHKNLVCRITLPIDTLIGFVPAPSVLVSKLSVRYEWQR